MYSGPDRHTAQFDVICCTVGHCIVIIQQANFDMGSINVIIFEERPRCVQSHWVRFG